MQYRVPGIVPGDTVQIGGVDHSSPSNAKVKNEWSYTSAPPICIHGVERNKRLNVFHNSTVTLNTEIQSINQSIYFDMDDYIVVLCDCTTTEYVLIRIALFWFITQLVVVISY